MKPAFFSGVRRLALIFAAALSGQGVAIAQNFIAPTIAQNALAPSNLATINTAMMDFPGNSGQLSAIAWSDFGSTYLYVENTLGTSAGIFTVANTNWGRPDVIIGDDLNNPGQDYVIAVTYQVQTSPGVYDIYVQMYQVTDGAGALIVTPGPNMNFGSGRDPKIDILADETMPIGGAVNMPAMHQFTLNFTGPGSGSQELYWAEMDFSNMQWLSEPLFSWGNDVTAIKDISSGNGYAYVSSTDGSSLYVTEFDLTNMTTSTNGYGALGNAYYTRIEGFGIYDPSWGIAKWGVASNDYFEDIVLYTDLGSFANATPYTYFTGYSDECPTIAAGIGPVVDAPDLLGNSQLSFAWASPGHDSFFSQALDYSGNIINPSDYLVVNNTPVSLPSDPPEMIALCNSSNGANNMLVAWNDGNDIQFKYTGGTFSYRPAGVHSVPKTEIISLAPNPAQAQVRITLPETGAQLAILNSLGAVVWQQQNAPASTTVDLRRFASGHYFVKVTGSHGTTTHKLVVQH